MKKFFALLLTAALLLGCLAFFAACEEEEKPASKSEPESSSAVSEVSSFPPAEPSSELSSLPEEESASMTQEPVSVEISSAEPKSLPVFDDNGLSTEKIGWGPGRGTNHNAPPAAANAQKKYGKYGACFLKDPEQKTIYLTFDEGYENGFTPKILDVLKDKQVHAAFFVTMDFVKSNPKLIRRMIDEGHSVGNHSTTHPSFPTISLEKQQAELTRLNEKVKTDFDYEMTLFRYPMGEFSEQSLAFVASCGYTPVFWSFAYRDWVTDDQPDQQASLKLLTDQLHGGAVYLLHAVSSTNTAILGSWIDAAREMGYTFGEL